MVQHVKFDDEKFNAFKAHEANLYNAQYFNVPPVFPGRQVLERAEAELFEIYRQLTGYTLNAGCDTCRCDNWKALARVYFTEKKRRAELERHSTVKIKKRKYTKKPKDETRSKILRPRTVR